MMRIMLVALASAAVACTSPTVVSMPDTAPSVADVAAGSGDSCPGDCDPAIGDCACDPANGGSDCSTGCCDVVTDVDGQAMRDASGNLVHGCVAPGCGSDGDCESGEICFADASCGQRACGCPAGIGPDPDQPCCLVTNSTGVCCTSGEVDAAGSCVCADPGMADRGNGCECADDMIPDESGTCVCADPNTTFDPLHLEPGAGACVCVAGTQLYVDPYTGASTCSAEPEPCADPNARVDPATGDCVCEPGFVLGDTLETVAAACVPITCGDDVCESGESCASCSYDCGPCEGGADAGVPDAPIDAAPDAGSIDAGSIDAGSIDAGPRDAMPVNDATACGSNASAVGCL